MKTKYCLAALTCVAALLTSGCANVPEGAGENPADPWEKMNRNTTAFNDTLDTYFLEPVAKGYRAVTPEPVREGVSNAFTNLGEPRNFVNNAFQGNVHGTMASLYRFVVNSVFGLGGLFDVAGKVAGVAEERTGFGTTLGRWGVPSGPYLVLPFFGPSSVRDAPGLLIDQAAHPVTYVKNPWIGWSVTGVRVVSLRTELLPMTDTLRGAVDPYVMAREAYLGNRRMTLGGEEENPFAVDEFEDEDQEPGLGEKLE